LVVYSQAVFGGAAPTVEMQITRTACAGAATAFVMRKLGRSAGAYAPGAAAGPAQIMDRVLYELSTDNQGRDLAHVQRWFAIRAAELARLGHRYGARLVAFRTAAILDWVATGHGHRGAVLVTAAEVLHPGAGVTGPHALAVTFDPAARRGGRDALIAVDPWPGIGRMAPPPRSLEEAHRRCLNRAFLLYSYGWS
jgi:hypothetical protein